MKVSVLDQSPISKGETAIEAIHHSIELAKLADELSFHRIWYAEHHGSKAMASAAPEILISHIASQTKRIRVGSGGIMMMHYSPLKMAEVFKTLTSLFPDRIDFGVGRAPGGNHFSTYALNQGVTPYEQDLYEKLEQTMKYMNETLDDSHMYGRTIAAPVGAPLPEVWLLGSSGSSAKIAGKMGVGYSFAKFIGGDTSPAVFDLYRNHFIPNDFMEKPQINISSFVMAAETKEEAEYHAAPLDLKLLELRRGKISNAITPEEALAYPYTEMEKMYIQENRRRLLVGSAKEVGETLRRLSEVNEVNEMMIVTVCHDFQAKLQSYRLLAKELLS